MQLNFKCPLGCELFFRTSKRRKLHNSFVHVNDQSSGIYFLKKKTSQKITFSPPSSIYARINLNLTIEMNTVSIPENITKAKTSGLPGSSHIGPRKGARIASCNRMRIMASNSAIIA